MSVLTSLEYMKLQPGDWVQLTNSRFSYNQKNFEVLSTQMEFAENVARYQASLSFLNQKISGLKSAIKGE